MSADTAASNIAVWAPYADQVDVVLGDQAPAAMQPDPYRQGWWTWVEPYDGAYSFRIDGRTHPDPRAAWLPEGPDGPAHTIDHSTYRWQDTQWHGRPLASAVIYECHVGTFSPQGTYQAVQERLDHLKGLGVNTLELLPLNTFPGRWGWGYDGVAWFAPQPSYGTPDELKALVDACHQRDIAVVVDAVYNHVGPAGNHLWAFGPYFTDRHHTPWGAALNVDGPDSDEVRRFVIDNVVMWLRDYHVDGLRLDAVHAIVDHSATHLLEELAARVELLSIGEDRTMWLIAESESNDPRLVRSREAHGYGLAGQWSDDLHHAVHVALTGEAQGYYSDFRGLRDVAKAYRHVFVRDGVYSPSLRRRHGRGIGELSSRRFVTALQNHDQIGNRAQGDRIGATAGLARQRIGAVLTLLAPTVPLLFQGEEWAASTPFQFFTDHTDPDLADAIRQGRRREFSAFGWRPEDVPDPQAESTFTASVLRWEELESSDHAEMLSWYRDLLQLRRRHPVTSEEVTVIHENDDSLVLGLGVMTIAVNLAAEPITLESAIVGISGLATSNAAALTSETVDIRGDTLHLGADSVAVFAPAQRRTEGIQR